MSFDRNDPTDLLELRAEVNNDPLNLGYAAVVDQTQALLDLLNGKEHSPTFIVSKPKISAAAIRGATLFQAYNGIPLSDTQGWLRWMTGSGGFDEESVLVTADLRTQLTGPDAASIWAAPDRTVMNQIMLDLIDVPGSRAEVLWDYGTVITRDDWIAARDYESSP